MTTTHGAWIAWNGNDHSYDMPLRVSLRFRDGTEHDDCDPTLYSWRDRSAEDDIVAYRFPIAPATGEATPEAAPHAKATAGQLAVEALERLQRYDFECRRDGLEPLPPGVCQVIDAALAARPLPPAPPQDEADDFDGWYAIEKTRGFPNTDTNENWAWARAAWMRRAARATTPVELQAGASKAGDAVERARKVGGSYQADGTIVARFKTLTGKDRVVFEFDQPAGMLHIFDTAQVNPIEASKEA